VLRGLRQHAPYANTQYPSFNFATALANQIKVSGSQTIYVTEAGWSKGTNAKDNSPNVSEDAAGRTWKTVLELTARLATHDATD